ncbi:4-hydroxy-3-methylbut-2-en-1-yl diphosphate synthase (flavodoxin) [Spirochaetia bacterium]|nr:4-hydroxy-3-methylbut-2-en-1-yl diphosphate synthase (flavodoxin) [Spirochaetia bacterium]
MSEVTIGTRGNLKSVVIGRDRHVVIQTMWKDKLTSDDLKNDSCKNIIKRIDNLSSMGCGLLRFAVPDIEAACVLGGLTKKTSMPLVADIHFDYNIALKILDYPIGKLRINPGNIGGREKVRAVLEKAKDKGVPIRIGVNGGSLPVEIRRLIEDGKINRTEALVEAAMREIAIFEENNFSDVVVSMKSSNIKETVDAARLFRTKNGGIPLHIGVTEAGPLIAGVVRNTAALFGLLCDGIGDTLRISLSDSMENEVIAAREILLAVNENKNTDNVGEGVKIISCPRCGRHSFDTHAFTGKWLPYLYSVRKNITVAIMGCIVNGPEEARNADIGITGVGKKVHIFSNGVVKQIISADEADAVFKNEIETFL